MNKREYIQGIQLKLGGNIANSEVTRKYPYGAVENVITSVWDNVLLEIYQSVKTEGKYYVFDNYTKVFTFPLKYDIAREEFYFNIPVSLAGIPNNVALRYLRPQKGRKNIDLVPIDQIDSYISLSFPYELAKETWGYVEGSNVYLNNNNCGKSIVASIVCSFRDYADEDLITPPVPMPRPNVVFGTVQEMVIASYDKQRPQDRLLDANPENIQKQ